jgi:hypothetical protein
MGPEQSFILDTSHFFTAFPGDSSLLAYAIPEIRIQKHRILLRLLRDQSENGSRLRFQLQEGVKVCAAVHNISSCGIKLHKMSKSHGKTEKEEA